MALYHGNWLVFKIKKTAAVSQIKTFIKFRILFNWEWRIVFARVGLTQFGCKINMATCCR